MLSSWELWLALCVGKPTALKLLSIHWGVEIKTLVEIGVYKGAFSSDLKHLFPEAHLYLIDPWDLYPEYEQPEAGPISLCRDDLHNAYKEVHSKFRNDSSVSILRNFSQESVRLIPDMIDLVYIDGNHAYEYVKEDIDLWLPKIRKGGMIAGDDYIPDVFPGVCRAVGEKNFSTLKIFPSGVWAAQVI